MILLGTGRVWSLVITSTRSLPRASSDSRGEAIGLSSALRTSRVERGLYYLEALETRPDSRGRGFASRLLTGVQESLKREGPFRLCDCVGKGNSASLKTHASCGFRIVSEAGYDYLRKETDPLDYGLEYRYGDEAARQPGV